MRVATALIPLLLLALAGCGAPDSGTDLVKLTNGHYRIAINPTNTFDPPHAHVPVGATVEWLDNGGQHDVTEDSTPPLWSSSQYGNGTALEFGETYLHTFNEAGTWHYRCTIHGGMGMVGAITVG
ncbi:MAG: plastocyanin/azurin family copper-binding protein [bacterium]